MNEYLLKDDDQRSIIRLIKVRISSCKFDTTEQFSGVCEQYFHLNQNSIQLVPKDSANKDTVRRRTRCYVFRTKTSKTCYHIWD